MERRVIDIDGPRRREREEGGGGGRIPVHKKVAASKTRSPPKIFLTTTVTSVQLPDQSLKQHETSVGRRNDKCIKSCIKFQIRLGSLRVITSYSPGLPGLPGAGFNGAQMI